MKKLTALIVTSVLATSCTWFKGEAKQAGTAIIDCSNVEKNLVEAQAGGALNAVIDTAEQIVQAVASGTTTSTIEGLLAKYGTPIVACVLKNMTGSGSATPSTGAPDPIAQAALKAIAQHGWQYK